MTAYRTSTAEDEAPYVNPYLERELLAYYRKQQRRNLVVFLVFLTLSFTVALWVLAARPAEGWSSTPAALFGVPGAFGVVIGACLLAHDRRPVLLERIRTGIAIRSIRRGSSTMNVRLAGTQATVVSKETPTIVVEFTDGRVHTLRRLDSLGELDRIESLLRLQMERAPR